MTWNVVLTLILATCVGKEVTGSKEFSANLVNHVQRIVDELSSGDLTLDQDPCENYAETEYPICKMAEVCANAPLRVKEKTLGTLCARINVTSLVDDESEPHQPRPAAVWGYSMLCVTVISLMSVMGVGILPMMSKTFYSSLLTCLIGLAVGSLSGSAFFHLIPSAFDLASVDFYPHHSYLSLSLIVWLGAYFFFLIERMLKIVMEIRSKNRSKRSIPDGATEMHLNDDHSHQSGGMTRNTESKEPILPMIRETNENDQERNMEGEEAGFTHESCGMENNEFYEQSMPAMRASFGHLERPKVIDNRPTVDQVSKSLKKGESPIATVAWMIIFGDGVHNFIDGLSIGAAFTESILTGISVSVAVLCEEFPHELGDFAVLLSSGMSVKQAMSYNFLSACTCYLGLICGILIGETHLGNQYIFALAGGMFLYIALVDMVPELNETVDSAAKRGSLRDALFTFFLQNVGIIMGIVVLYVLAKFQDDIQVSL